MACYISDDKREGEAGRRLPQLAASHYMVELTEDLPEVRKWIKRNYDKSIVGTDKVWPFLQELSVMLVLNGLSMLWRGVLLTDQSQEIVQSQLVRHYVIAEKLDWPTDATILYHTLSEEEDAFVLWSDLAFKRKGVSSKNPKTNPLDRL